MAKNPDKPLEVRLHKQIGKLLDDLETEEIEITFPQRLNALIAVGRLLGIFSQLRARSAKLDDPGRAGSAVRAYTEAFQISDASRRRTVDTGQPAEAGGDNGLGGVDPFTSEDDDEPDWTKPD
ncbi:MAG TPA: hypothetical protein VKP67_23235 [Xanthobacteraceae bacterium]|nr:hypothetical protein [Xanthobacteraceae bacterium]